MKKKTMVLFFTILCFILLLVGGSYAYWSWNSDKDKNLVFNTAKGLEEYIIYDEGDSYFIGNFQPVDSFCLSAHNTISFYKTEEAANVSLLASVKMNVNSIGENSSLSNDVYWIITSGDSNIDCNDGLNSSNVLNYGSFNGMSSGDVITLLSDEEVTLTEKKFTVWIWIDNASANLSSLSGETIDTNIWTQIDMIESESSVADGAASPVLDEGMIPVTEQ